jgi:hypothetical protein
LASGAELSSGRSVSGVFRTIDIAADSCPLSIESSSVLLSSSAPITAVLLPTAPNAIDPDHPAVGWGPGDVDPFGPVHPLTGELSGALKPTPYTAVGLSLWLGLSVLDRFRAPDKGDVW